MTCVDYDCADRRRSIRRLALTAALVLMAYPALADVDTDVLVPVKLRGTLAGAEIETFRFFAPEGATLAAKLSTSKKAGVDVGLRLLDPEGAEHPLPVANVTDKGASIKVKKLVLDQSGTWALEVTADRAGDYKLSIKTNQPKKRSFDVTLAGGPVPVTIPAAFGSTLKITAKAPRGGTATPVLQSLDGADISQEGKRTDSSHKATVVAGTSGDLVLDVASGGGDGPVSVTVVIKPPKRKAAKLDVTPSALGRQVEGETLVGRVIEPAIGGLIAAGAESDIFGASLDVPAGALTDPTLISLGSAAPAVIPDPDSVGAGPTIELQAPVLELGAAATLSVPVDPAVLPIQTTAGDIRILEEMGDGSTRTVVPTSVDLEAGVATTPVSSFTSAKNTPATTTLRFTAIAPAGSPPLAGREYWGFTFDANLEADQTQSGESGIRRVYRAEVLLEFDPDGTSWTAELEERELRFGLARAQDEGLEPVLDVTAGGGFDSGTWDYGSGGRRVRLFPQSEGGEERLFVSRDGSILLNTTDEPEEGTPEDALLDVFVERPTVSDPTALLVGTYHMGELNFRVGDEGGAGLSLEFLSTFGTLTFRSNGVLSVDVTHAEAFATDDVVDNIFEFDETRDRGNTLWSVDSSGLFAGSVLIDDGDGGEFRLFPHRDGRMFVAMQRSAPDEKWAFLIGVRASSGQSAADLEGDYAVGTCFLEPNEYQIEDGQQGSGQVRHVPDFALSSESSRLIFDGAGGVTLSPRSAFYQERDTQAPGGVREDRQIGSDLPLQYTLARDGKFEIVAGEDELRGGVSADGSLGFAVQDPDKPTFGLVIFVDRPPQQPPP